jgi:Fe-S-cluster-containing hydrogenase component 2
MQIAWVKVDRCAGCGVCADTCPSGAITMKDGKAYVEDRICTGCGDCVEMCPEGAITLALQGELVPARQQTELASPPRSPAVVPIVIAGAGLLIRAAEIALQVFEHRSERYSTMSNVLNDASTPYYGRGGGGRRRRRRRRGR